MYFNLITIHLYISKYSILILIIVELFSHRTMVTYLHLYFLGDVVLELLTSDAEVRNSFILLTYPSSSLVSFLAAAVAICRCSSCVSTCEYLGLSVSFVMLKIFEKRLGIGRQLIRSRNSKTIRQNRACN